MAAVVRLKRRLDEEPLEALVLACKRNKTEEDAAIKDETPITAILKFAGTVENQEEDVAVHINKSIRKGSSRTELKHVVDVSGKVRAETKQLSQQNRFKVVNCFRALKESDVAESEEGSSSEKNDKLLTVFDVVSHSEDEDRKNKGDSVDSKAQVGATPEADYVYDLYYTNMTGSDGLVSLDNLLGVHAYHSEWELRSPEEDSDESVPGVEDEDDSNDENNWRNDYPDSDHSLDEDDMRMAMQEMNIAEDDISSDDAADDFVFGVTVDPSDVALYGEGYASYKARVLNELKSDEQGAYSREAYDADQDEDADEDPVLRFM